MDLRRFLVCASVGLTALVPTGCGSDGGDDGDVKIVAVGDAWGGATHEDLSAAWWNWCSSIRYDEHPIASDLTGEFAGIGQSGDVWFLGGTFGGYAERTVTIPEGKAVFFPLFNTAFWLPEDAPTLAACADAAADGPDACDILECEIDGEAVEDPFSFRIPSGPWLLEIPAGGIFTEPVFGGYAPGVRTSMGDGFWIFLEPLPRGQHTIYIHGGVTAWPFEVETLYHITVE
jgi:hypothetical protein